MYEHLLTSIGLTEKESVVYESLLRVGPVTMPVLLEKTGYKRGDMYNILASLEGWRLIEVTGDGHKQYAPTHPSRLQDLVKEQEQEVLQTKKSLSQGIHGLAGMFNMISGKPGVRMFEGNDGFKEALFDSLSATETIYTIADIESAMTHIPLINREYTKKREQLGIRKNILVVDTPFSRKFAGQNASELVCSRFLPKSMQCFESSIQIYDKKIVYMTLREKQQIAIIIEDEAIYRMQRALFEAQWSMAEKIRYLAASG